MDFVVIVIATKHSDARVEKLLPHLPPERSLPRVDLNHVMSSTLNLSKPNEISDFNELIYNTVIPFYDRMDRWEVRNIDILDCAVYRVESLDVHLSPKVSIVKVPTL